MPKLDKNYWQSFLEAMNLIGPISEETRRITSQHNLSSLDMQLIRDPYFELFIKYGPGKTGYGPKTIAEFLELPEDQKQFYAKVFREWKKIIKQKGIGEKLLKAHQQETAPLSPLQPPQLPRRKP